MDSLVRRLTTRPVVFMFHSIGRAEVRQANGDRTSFHRPEAFAGLLDWLTGRLGARVVSLRSLVDGSPRPRSPTAVLTFDDGCRDHFTTVFPALTRRGLTATFFVPLVAIGSPTGLTAGMLAEMAAGGMDIGAHTVTHPHLTRLPDAAVHRELIDSRTALSDLSGAACESFAYPYGDGDERVKRLVREAGFRCAVGAFESGPADDPYEIPRKYPPARNVALAFAASWLGLMPRLRQIRR